METLPVTLIVKAPNQQIEDQTIKCELSWTINKLKQHLSEVYPSKPAKHEQKLIYSGQLLSDGVMLKDVLRQFEGQETHTVHLVCTPQQNAASNKPFRSSAESVQAQSRTIPTANNQSQTPQSSASSNSNNASRGGGNNTGEQRVPNMPWVNGGPMDPNQYAMQLAWMQQAYLQYMTQYMQLASNSYGTGTPYLTTQGLGGGHGGPNAANAPAPDQMPQGNPGAEQPAAAAAPQAAPAQRDPENPERDWLDVFYLLVRAMVLFSIVYFYSSPLRFIFVLFLGFGLYLYQTGFFRNINNINNNNNNVPAEPAPQEELAPSRLMLVWTFLTTFFSSLIPEIPNAI